MKLSVIILNYNVRYFLELCLISVQKAIQNIDAEIIVVDNNSPDDSCSMIKERFPEIILIENKENSGFPKGNNIGVAASRGEYLCILNPDTVVAENTFFKVLAFIESLTNPGIVGVKLIDGTGKFLPESKRGVPTPMVALTKVTGLYKISNFFGNYYAQHLSKNQTGKIDILVGAFMILKKETYVEVGGFDENCFMYSDDIDLSYMILKSGKENYYFHETTVIHYKGESTVRDENYMLRFRDAMNFFYKKHFNSSYVFDLFMKVGAFVFAKIKRTQGEVVKFVPDEYYLISKNEGLLVEVEKLLGKNVTRIENDYEKMLNSLMLANNRRKEFFFDNEFLSFEIIIGLMETFANSRFTFKIIPKNSNFLIGSNSSNDRGEIIKLQNYLH